MLRRDEPIRSVADDMLAGFRLTVIYRDADPHERREVEDFIAELLSGGHGPAGSAFRRGATMRSQVS